MEVQFGKSLWWGGLLERPVKRVLRKVLKNNHFDYEELETIIVEVEGTLNNRPLTYYYDEVHAEMLTPLHLLHGYRFGLLNSFPAIAFELYSSMARALGL